MECPHGHQVMACGHCLAKKAWPRGHKACPCGRFIPKKEWRCNRCRVVLTALERDGMHQAAKARFHATRQLNV